MRHLLTALSLALAASGACAQAQAPAPAFGVAERISADSLRGHLSFLSSALLEGRGTPSRGLDLAAEYIAAQFRRAGLEAVGDDGYFQTTTLTARGSDKPEKVRNVIGILRGSDPTLKDTYILVTAHYDHLGIRPDQPGDNIF